MTPDRARLFFWLRAEAGAKGFLPISLDQLSKRARASLPTVRRAVADWIAEGLVSVSPGDTPESPRTFRITERGGAQVSTGEQGVSTGGEHRVSTPRNENDDENDTSSKHLEVKDSSRSVRSSLPMLRGGAQVSTGEQGVSTPPIAVVDVEALARLGYSIVPTVVLERLMAQRGEDPEPIAVVPIEAAVIPREPRAAIAVWADDSPEKRRVKQMCDALLGSYPKDDGSTGAADVQRFQLAKVRRAIHHVILHVLSGEPVTKSPAAIFWAALTTADFKFQDGALAGGKEFAALLRKKGFLARAEGIAWLRWFFSAEGLDAIGADEPPKAPPRAASDITAELARRLENVGRLPSR